MARPTVTFFPSPRFGAAVALQQQPGMRLRLRTAWATGELARGSVVNLGFAVVNAAMAFAATVFAGRALGPAGVGVLALGFFVLDLAGMLDNLGSAGFMRDYAAGEEPRKLATVLRLKVLLGLGTAGLMAVLAWPLSVALSVPLELLLLFAAVPLTSIPSSVATMVHESRRRPWRRSTPGTSEAAVKLAMYAGLWLIVGASSGVMHYAWAALAASLGGALVGAVLIPPARLRDWDPGTAKSYLHFGLAAQAAGFLQKLQFWTDILLIDLLLQSHYQQGLYRTAYSVMAFIPLFAGTVAVFLFPAMSEASQLGDAARVRSLLRKSFGAVLAIAVPMALAALLLARPALRLFGPDFLDADWMLRGLAIIALLPALLVPFQALFPALGRPGISMGITAAMVALNVVLDLALIPVIGVLGALISSGCAFGAGLVLSFAAAQRMGVLGSPGGAPA